MRVTIPVSLVLYIGWTSVQLVDSASVHSTSNNCTHANVTNGCSNPLVKIDPTFSTQMVNEMFEYDCNRHDICYQCGHTLGINRTMCDAIFLANMKKTCHAVKKRFLLEEFAKNVGNYFGNAIGTAANIVGNALLKPVKSVVNSLSTGKLVSKPGEAVTDFFLSPVHAVGSVSCGVAAEMYYSAVRVAGNSHFDQTQHIECSEAWVQPCLPNVNP